MSTVLLLPFQGADNSTDFIDRSPFNRTISVIADAKISRAVNDPFGNAVGVGYFDGAADGITFANTSDFDFGSGKFTIQFWGYRLGVNANYSRIYNPDGDYYNGTALVVDPSGYLMTFGTANDGVWNLWSAPYSPLMPLGSWHYYALVRDGDVVTLYEGATPGAATTSHAIATLTAGATLFQTSQANLCIGGQHGVDRSFYGYLSNFKIDKGVALDCSTVPTAAFPDENHEYTDEISAGLGAENTVEIALEIIDPVVLIVTFLEFTGDYTDEIVLNLLVQNDVQTYLGHETVDMIKPGFVINNSYSYEVYIPTNWIQRNFIAQIGDLTLPIASFNATLSASGSSYVTLQIPALSSQLLDDIIARQAEPIIISRSHLYSDGSTKAREFIRVNYEAITSDTGPQSGMAITLSGRKYVPVSRSKDVVQTEKYYHNFAQGKLRYRMPVNDAINLGDRLFIDDTDFIVGKITYYISTANEFMECQEYIADGTDNNGIGSNVRATPLQEYLVEYTNSNYFLWQAQGYLFNGRAMNPADNTNYPYLLWYDSTGLLWYAENFPVYEVDGVTQASVNV